MHAWIITFPNHLSALQLHGPRSADVLPKGNREVIGRSRRMSPRIILPALGASVCLSLTLLFANLIVS